MSGTLATELQFVQWLVWSLVFGDKSEYVHDGLIAKDEVFKFVLKGNVELN